MTRKGRQMATRQGLKARLADIDAHVEHVASMYDSGNDLSVLAYAVHNLVEVIREMLPEG